MIEKKKGDATQIKKVVSPLLAPHIAMHIPLTLHVAIGIESQSLFQNQAIHHTK